MKETFESLQASAMEQLRKEGRANVVGSIPEAVTILKDASRKAVTIVLQDGHAMHGEIMQNLGDADIKDRHLKAWSRGNLPGVIVYEIAA